MDIKQHKTGTDILMSFNNKYCINANTGFDTYRCSLLEQLPVLLERATNEYRRFAATDPTEDAKEFAAYQAGCKAALTHIQMLIKLSSWVDPNIWGSLPGEEEDSLSKLIDDAKNELRGRRT